MGTQVEGIIVVIATATVVLWRIFSAESTQQDRRGVAGYLFAVSLLILLIATLIGSVMPSGGVFHSLLLGEERLGIHLAVGIGYGILAASAICSISSFRR